MKYSLYLLLSFFSVTLCSQNAVGEIQLKEGGKIAVYDGANAKKKTKFRGGVSSLSLGAVGFNEAGVFYFAENGDKESVKISNVVYVNYLDRIYIPLEIRKKRHRMMELIAKNDNYILANFTSNGLDYFYISDRDYNMVEKQIIHTASKNKSKKAIAKVKEYFSDCTELIEGLELNFSKPHGKGFMARYHLTYHKEDDEEKNTLTNIDCTSE